MAFADVNGVSMYTRFMGKGPLSYLRMVLAETTYHGGSRYHIFRSSINV